MGSSDSQGSIQATAGRTPEVFVTVGVQLPFDRLIEWADEWAGEHPDVAMFAQIGRSNFRPSHMEFASFLAPAIAQQWNRDARVVVSHAGMGTLLERLCGGRPVIIMPRDSARGEHRTDHQTYTASQFHKFPAVSVVLERSELHKFLDCRETLAAQSAIAAEAPSSLIANIRTFVES